ncbi:hypothetical protein [Falsiruegeria litorea]|uniref:hypothetical protein n=1 Tax=Falsiruegeria litorea TaxID=1280831 RepID=UPI001BFD65B8|nr:hypothetical protein [Falsiruegeria litorea]MBT8169674.1 hypothetical protein [Falsiruegeria litorea]
MILDFMGWRVDVRTLPAFCVVSHKLAWHRPSRQWIDIPALRKSMTDAGYTEQAGEIGSNPASEKLMFDMHRIGTAAPTPPVVAPTVLTPTSDLAGQRVAFTGPDPTLKRYVVTVDLESDGPSHWGPVHDNLILNAGTTLAQVAAAVAASVVDPDVVATVAGGVVNFTPAPGTATKVVTLSVTAAPV